MIYVSEKPRKWIKKVGPWGRVIMCHCGQCIVDVDHVEVCPSCGCKIDKSEIVTARQEWEEWDPLDGCWPYGVQVPKMNAHWVRWTGCWEGDA